MRDEAVITKSDIVNLPSTKGTNWVMFVDEFLFDSYGSPPRILLIVSKIS